jgi:hypothetical protein
MRKVLLSALFVSATFVAFSQAKQTKKTTTTTKKTMAPAKKGTAGKWKAGGMISVAMTQSGSRNWSGGGDRFSISENGFLTLWADYTKGKCHFDNTVDANYGFMNTDKYGTVKNDDKLELYSKWSHELGKGPKTKWRLSFVTDFRTQFVDGYDYDAEGTRTRISSFLAPANFYLSPGIAFAPNKHLYAHLSPFTGRWVIVANRPYELAANYGVTPNQEVRIEAGALASIGYNGDIAKNVYYRGRADFFADYLHAHPTNVDIYFTNTFYLKVNKYLAVIYNFDLQYDDNTKIFGYYKSSPGIQLKSILGVGLSVKF